MKNKARRNVFILSLCVVASIPFVGNSVTFETAPVDKKEASINSASLNEILVDEEERVLESYLDKCDDLISFVESNFSTFVREYNTSIENTAGELKASYVEYTSYTYIIEDETFGVYFDFDEDNGYAVISPDYEMYGLEVSGDLVELRDYDTLMYSELDGFVYYDENGILQRVYDDYPDEYCYSKNNEENPYPGQDGPGDGEIESGSIGEYVDWWYDDYTYESKNENLASGFDYGLMEDTSYYIQRYCDEEGNKLDETWWTEGNCSLNAMFNVVRNWAKCSLIKGGDYTSATDISKTIENDPLYEEYGTKIVKSKEVEAEEETETYSSKGTITQYYYWEPNYTSKLKVMPNLYSNIRKYAINNYGYTPESGFLASNVPNTIETTLASNYGTNVNVSYTSSIEEAISSIDDGKAAYMAINNSSTYGNHGVALIGYQMYSYKTGWWIFKSTHYAYFYEIADGWNSTPMYFDPNTDANPSLHFSILEK